VLRVSKASWKQFNEKQSSTSCEDKETSDGIKSKTCIPKNLLGSRTHIEAEDLMRKVCADSIRARDIAFQSKAGYMGAIFF